jgi:2-polyprenyl-3-methyl-5-hydroxy-6-metoxy-1,4-benzoquinol methylase
MKRSTNERRSAGRDMTQASLQALDDNAGERMIPEVAGRCTFWEHVYRYAFASRFARGKEVLDIACGEGYGTAALRIAGATHVIGVDVSEAVCAHARVKYGVETRQGSAEEIPLAKQSVDLVVSFETIEHLRNPLRFLDECVRVLRENGLLVISTPNRDVYRLQAATLNPHHCSEMTIEQFSDAVAMRFRSAKYYSQRPYSAAWWSLRTLAADQNPWVNHRLFSRVYRSARFRLAPDVIDMLEEPETERRNSVVDLVAQISGKNWTAFDPFAVRPLRPWLKERPTYVISAAVR